MKTTDLVIRIILGIGLVFFGLNGFFHWMTPPPSPEGEVNFMMALGKAGYVFPIVYTVLIISGVSFLSNKLVPIGLLILTPILINIVLVHLVFSPQAILFGGVFFILMIILYCLRWKNFLPLFNHKHSI
jgi:putative oxidoreductase